MENHKKASVLGGTMIVAGTIVGAGMLTLPILSAGMWFSWAMVVMLATFALMYLSAEMILEVNLNYKPGASFHTLVHDNLGHAWNVINGASVAFVLYILVYAYISGSSSVISDTALRTFNIALPQPIAGLIFSIIFTTVVWYSTKAVDRLSVILVVAMVITLFAALSGLIGKIEADKLFRPNGENRFAIYAIASLPYFLTSFCFHASVPSLVKYFGINPKSVRKCIFFGMSVALTFYLLWILACFGNVTRETFTAPEARGGNVASMLWLLRTANAGQILNYTTSLFAFFAVVSSFLGAGLGLFDYIADLLKMSDTPSGRFKTALITFVPPTIGGVFFPNGFVKAIGYAGFAAAVWSVIVPGMMVMANRKKRQSAGASPIFTALGGSIAPLIIVVYGAVTAICHILVEVLKIIPLY